MNHETQLCIDTMGRKSGGAAGVSGCHGIGGNQVNILDCQVKNGFNLMFISRPGVLPEMGRFALTKPACRATDCR